MERFLNLLLFLVALVSLTGCWSVTKGSRTTIYYDDDGTASHSVTEDVAIGDKYTAYSTAAATLSSNSKETIAARVQAVVDIAKPLPGESVEALAYKSAMGYMALAMIKGDPTTAIKALHYGKDGYDVADSGVGMVKTVASVGVVSYGTTKILDKAFAVAGDRVDISGDGNDYSKSQTSSEIHANTTGDGSPSTVNTEQGGAASSSDSGASDGEDDSECGEQPAFCPDPVCKDGTWWVDSSNEDYGMQKCEDLEEPEEEPEKEPEEDLEKEPEE